MTQMFGKKLHFKISRPSIIFWLNICNVSNINKYGIWQVKNKPIYQNKNSEKIFYFVL